jgi:hypothetical protein
LFWGHLEARQIMFVIIGIVAVIGGAAIGTILVATPLPF